jgi:DNA (cytosine-5)-methyltransferase 1
MTSRRGLISLFCGAGGLDSGFAKEGFTTLLALDHEQAAVDSFNANHDGKVARKVDLGRYQTKKFLELVAEVAGKDAMPVGLIGGPPCQGVSAGNSSSGPGDPRNSLMGTYLRLVNAAHAAFDIDFFVFENVPGLLRSANATRLRSLKAGLSKNFYISLQEINAKNFGVPQSRRRVLIIGLNKRHYKLSEVPKLVGSEVLSTVRDAIGSLPEATYFSRGLLPNAIPFHPNHWTMRPISAKFTKERSTVKGRSFQRLYWDKPSRTVAYGHREIHVHPEGHRRVSVLEAMLLQGFDKNYVLHGSLSKQIEQVSNAVPPPLAQQVAKAILAVLKEGEP